MYTIDSEIIEYDVTEDDIRTSNRHGRNNHYYCPTAKAVKRLVNHGVAIGWGYGQVYWEDNQPGTWYTVEDRGFERSFDKGYPVHPYKGRLIKEQKQSASRPTGPIKQRHYRNFADEKIKRERGY